MLAEARVFVFCQKSLDIKSGTKGRVCVKYIRNVRKKLIKIK